MATYWHLHPRGFANECSIYRAENELEETDLEAGGYERLTRREMERHIRWVNDENESWGSGRAFGKISIKDVVNSSEYSAANLDRREAWGVD